MASRQQHVHLQVDAALIAQLRTGYAEVAQHKLANVQLDRVEERHALLPASDTPATPPPHSTPLP
jgi:hypothetical protein